LFEASEKHDVEKLAAPYHAGRYEQQIDSQALGLVLYNLIPVGRKQVPQQLL
jgi:hypothetical protein